MDNLSDISAIKALLSKYGFHFSKALGQNFLVNPTVCPRMAEFCCAEPETSGVIEIGPGIGVLTKELCKRFKKVVAIELDTRLLPLLAETLSEYDHLKIVSGDVLKLDLKSLIAEEFPQMEVHVCANLPYYITSPVILRFLEEQIPVESLTVMVQKEAAERLCAKPGERECGAVSAAVWYRSEPKKLFSVSRGSFLPAPNVDSAVMKLTVRKVPPVEVPDEAQFFAVVRAAFCQRRKTLLNAVSSGLSVSKELLRDAMRDAGISDTIRAEQMTLSDFAVLSMKIKERS